jgi:DNA repair exonuclease SbcCD ATPase subunit
MGRAGIYKSEVIRARERLLAQGKNPSIDAIRVELGNTGSRTTISRYLREILEEEAENGPAPEKPDTSEAILALVRSLAGQLESDASARLEAARAEFLHAKEQLLADLESCRAEALRLEGELRTSHTVQTQQEARIQTLEIQAQHEAQTRREQEQQAEALHEQLAAGQRHIQSLEEKHAHARQALEHFREAAREQREQEARQHEQQVQYLQGEIRALREQAGRQHEEQLRLREENTRLQAAREAQDEQLQALTQNLAHSQAEAARLPALEHAQASLSFERDQARAALASLQADQTRHQETLGAQLAERDARLQALALSLAEARASLQAKDELVRTLQTWAERIQPARPGNSQA